MNDFKGIYNTKNQPLKDKITSTFDDIIPQILLVTQDIDDVEDYLYALGYTEQEIIDYGGVIPFINKNSTELDLALVHHYNK